jgi:hypothetical protein
MNAMKQPDTNATTREASSARCADFDAAGSGLFSDLEQIELARIITADGKKLFCRLPSPLRLALRACLTAGGGSGAAPQRSFRLPRGAA